MAGHNPLRADLIVARDSLEEAQHRYLKQATWEHTSQTPDFCWRWTKTFDGICYALPTEEAVKMQEYVDDWVAAAQAEPMSYNA